jgi:hypothetical protein
VVEVGEEKKKDGKIRLGKLAVDPVFFALFVFFTISALTMLSYLVLASR